MMMFNGFRIEWGKLEGLLNALGVTGFSLSSKPGENGHPFIVYLQREKERERERGGKEIGKKRVKFVIS